MKISRKIYLEVLGWAGGIVCLIGYALITHQIISSGSPMFLTMNTIGCCCLIYYTFRKRAFANAALNSVHLLITLIAVGKHLMS